MEHRKHEDSIPAKSEMPLAAAMTRRQANLMLAAAIAAAFSEAINTGVGVAPYVKEWWNGLDEIPKSTSDLVRAFLFRSSENQYYAASKDNPYGAVKGITPPTRDALRSTLRVLGYKEEEMEAIETLCTPQLDGSAVFFGGPVANIHSRQILGIGKGSPLLSKSEGRAVQPPIHFGNVLVRNPKADERPPLYGDWIVKREVDQVMVVLLSYG